MAAKLGVGLSSYQYYERGERDAPGEILCKIVTFGVNGHWLLTGEGGVVIQEEVQPELSMEGEAPPIYMEGEEDRPAGALREPADPAYAGELDALLTMTAVVLRSGTEYADSLAANIRSFHKSVKMERRLTDRVEPKSTVDRLEDMEKKIRELEGRLAERPAAKKAAQGQ